MITSSASVRQGPCPLTVAVLTPTTPGRTPSSTGRSTPERRSQGRSPNHASSPSRRVSVSRLWRCGASNGSATACRLSFMMTPSPIMSATIWEKCSGCRPLSAALPLAANSEAALGVVNGIPHTGVYQIRRLNPFPVLVRRALLDLPEGFWDRAALARPVIRASSLPQALFVAGAAGRANRVGQASHASARLTGNDARGRHAVARRPWPGAGRLDRLCDSHVVVDLRYGDRPCRRCAQRHDPREMRFPCTGRTLQGNVYSGGRSCAAVGRPSPPGIPPLAA